MQPEAKARYGWSRDILFRDLDAFYRGVTAELPSLPVQYADFAIWQREQLSGDRLSRLIHYSEKCARWRAFLD